MSFSFSSTSATVRAVRSHPLPGSAGATSLTAPLGYSPPAPPPPLVAHAEATSAATNNATSNRQCLAERAPFISLLLPFPWVRSLQDGSPIVLVLHSPREPAPAAPRAGRPPCPRARRCSPTGGRLPP